MERIHEYYTEIKWTGNRGTGTSAYQAYSRDHSLYVEKKPEVNLSSDPSFRGDRTRYNPEELFLASLSSCHMLWYLHLCAEAGICVVQYTDKASGTMTEDDSGGGRFTGVVLHPEVIITDKNHTEKALAIHHLANEKCFIANSCNFPVRHQCAIGIMEAQSDPGK